MIYPSFKQIRYFIAVAQSGQISKAALALYVSQSAVTTAIKGLEDIVGTKLIKRIGGGVSVTYEGGLFLEHALNIISAVDEAVRVPRMIRHDMTGKISIAVTYTVGGYFAPRYLAKFSRSYPNIDLKINEETRNNIELGLLSEDFDLAIMLTSNIVNHEDISHEVLLRSRRRLWVPAQHQFTSRPSVSLRDISEQPYIMLTVDEASNTAQRYWNKTLYRPNVRLRTSSVEAVRSMVANGMGVAILSDMVYRPWSLEGRRIDVLPVAEPIPSMDIGIAWANSKEKNEAVKLFIEFMHLSIGSEQPMG